MPRHKNAFIASALAALMLSTACSTTENITITAPGDTTAPADGTTVPGDTTAPADGTTVPGDTTAPADGTTVPGDTTAPADGTTSPGGGTGMPDDIPTGDSTTSPGDTPAPTDITTTTDTSETSVTASDQDSADGQESAEPASFTYEYPEFLLINRNDRSTPVGKLCWAVFEHMSNTLIRTSRIVAEINPDWEVTFPAIADITEGEDNSVGPVGVVNEESSEPSIGTEDYFIESLGEILEPSIAGVVDDPGLSEELQLFAAAFFAYVEAEEEQIRAVGWANIDRTRLPYQDSQDMPHMKEFEKTFIANPDKCAFPSEDEWARFLDEQETELEEYLEETGGLATIE